MFTTDVLMSWSANRLWARPSVTFKVEASNESTKSAIATERPAFAFTSSSNQLWPVRRNGLEMSQSKGHSAAEGTWKLASCEMMSQLNRARSCAERCFRPRLLALPPTAANFLLRSASSFAFCLTMLASLASA